MTAVKCLTEALDVWKERGIYDRPEMRTYVEKIEDAIKNRKLSDARKLQIARVTHQKSIKKQFQLQVGNAVSAEKIESVTTQLLRQMDEDPKSAIRALRDLIEFGVSRGRAVRAEGTVSLVGLRKAIQTEIDSQLFDIKKRYFGSARLSSTEDANLLRLAMEGGDPQNAQIAADARRIKEVLAPYLQELRSLGVYVDELELWSPGRPMEGRVRAHQKEFETFLRNNLDEKYHPDIEDSIAFIKDSILNPTPPRDNVLSFSREVFFKTAEARVEYMQRFGQADFVEALAGYTSQLSQTIAEARIFGPDSHRAVQKIADTVLREAVRRDPSITTKSAQIVQRFEVATNRIQDVLNPTAASVAGSSRNFASGLFLGAVPLAQVSQDALLAPIRLARSFGWGNGFADTIASYGKIFDPQVRKYLQEELGIMEHVSHLLTPDARIILDSPSTNVENFSKKFAIQVMRLAGTELLEQIQRGVTTMALSRGIVRNLNRSFDDLDDSLRILLENNAIGKRSWNNLVSQRDAIIDPDLNAIRLDNISNPDLRRAMRSLLVRETENIILRPDTTTRAFMLGGPRGTVGGEITRFSSQFLSWPIQFARSVTARQLSLGVPGALAGFAGLWAMSIVTEQLYAVARGQPGYALDNPNIYWRSLVRSGLLTPIGELAVGAALGDWRSSPSLGPVLDTTAQLFGRAGRIGQAVFEQEPYDAMSEAVRGTRTLLPNIWWVEGAIIEPAFRAIMWEIDPQHMRQRERNWERERQ
jgi:hypothetical protein